jgi:hypothetical protein
MPELKQETDMQWAQWESILYDYHLVDKEIQNKKTKEVTGIGFESAITHAFCITAFQAQGSGWDNCFIDLADMNVLLKVGDGTIEEKRESRNRAVYVAMSRAKKRIFALI